MSAMATNYSIEKLGSDNYSSWSSDVKFLLMEKNVWDIIEDEKQIPVKSEAVSDADIEKFKSRRNLALSIIYLNVESELRRIIEDYTCPILAWKELRKNYCPDTRSLHMQFFTKMLECRIDPGEKINLFAARILRLYNRIKGFDKNFSENYASFQLLRYLPTCFDGIVQNILRWKEADFVFNSILSELVSEEARLVLRDEDGTNVIGNQEHFNISSRRRNKFFNRSKKTNNQFKNNQDSNQCSTDKSFSFSLTNKDHHRSPSVSNRRDGSVSAPTESRGIRASSPFEQRSRGRRGGRGRFRTYQSPTRYSRKLNYNYFLEANVTESKSDGGWLFDTGATSHFCRDSKLFSEYTPVKDKIMSVAIKDAIFPIQGTGTVKLKIGKNVLVLKNVMHSSDLKRNLISGARLDKEGYSFLGRGGEVRILRHDKFLFKAYLKNNVYCLYPKIISGSKVDHGERVTFEASHVDKEDNLKVWHRRMGHVSPSLLIHTQHKEGVKGLPSLNDKNFDCEFCKVNKFRRVSFKPLGNIRSKCPLQLIFADVWGPSPVPGKKGERYFLSIIDDYSRKVALYPILTKAVVFDVVKQHIIRAERFLGCRVKSFRSDNGSEFDNQYFQDFFNSRGIRHEFTNIYTPEQNGVVERYNQTVVDGARTILNESGLDHSFWPDAMLYFSYTWNRVCSKSFDKTPIELYSGFQPSVRHLQAFGTLVYVGIPKQKRNKLSAKAQRGVMIGYAMRTKGYRVWLIDTKKVVETCNVSFGKILFKDFSSGAVLAPRVDIPRLSEDIESSRNDVVEVDPNFGDPSGVTGGLSDLNKPVDKSPDGVLKTVNWYRKAVPRKTGNKIDIYYYEKDKAKRLRSLEEVKGYCQKNSIKFDPSTFNFSGKDQFTGDVVFDQDSDDGDSSSHA